MNELELAIVKFKRAGYEVRPNAGKFDVIRPSSRLRLTKDELIKYAEEALR